MKRLLVLGATGGTGRQVVTQALEAGHQVTAFVRSPERLPDRHEHLSIVAGRLPDDAATLRAAAEGHDAVISALGRGNSFKAEGLIARSVPVVLDAMRATRVRRLIFTSAIGVGEAAGDAPLFSRLLIRFLLSDIYADKAIGEDLVRRSDLDWTILQPAQLTDGPLTGTYQYGMHLRHRGMPKISRADLAHFIVHHLDDPATVRTILRLAS